MPKTPRRMSQNMKAPPSTPDPEKEGKALQLAQERLLARRQALIPLQVLDDWPFSPFQGEEQLPRELIARDLTQIAQQPRFWLRRWAAHCLQQVSLSESQFVTVDRQGWHDLQWYSAATAELNWPSQGGQLIVNYSSAGFTLEPIIHVEDDEEGWDRQRHLRFNDEGEWRWGRKGGLWQPYLVFLTPARPQRRFR